MSAQKPYGCGDYRIEMLLAGLQARLRRNDLSPEERQALEKELRSIEAEFYDRGGHPVSSLPSFGQFLYGENNQPCGR